MKVGLTVSKKIQVNLTSWYFLFTDKLSATVKRFDANDVKLAKRAFQSCVTAPERNIQHHCNHFNSTLSLFSSFSIKCVYQTEL